jgi:hypothetical protein
MLEIKANRRESENKKRALKEVCKENNLKGISALIPKKVYKKLRAELTDKELTMAEWICEKIENI